MAEIINIRKKWQRANISNEDKMVFEHTNEYREEPKVIGTFNFLVDAKGNIVDPELKNKNIQKHLDNKHTR